MVRPILVASPMAALCSSSNYARKSLILLDFFAKNLYNLRVGSEKKLCVNDGRSARADQTM